METTRTDRALLSMFWRRVGSLERSQAMTPDEAARAVVGELRAWRPAWLPEMLHGGCPDDRGTWWRPPR